MIKILFVILFLVTSMVNAHECPMHKDNQHNGVNERGNKAMGFDHTKTTHHFLVKKDGGIIQVQANHSEDLESVNAIRIHLSHIAVLFSKGDFDMPMFIHDRVPDGVPIMKELKAEIQYKYEDIDKGGKVIIASNNSDAVKAIHEFLRFQIKDHRTGDAVEMPQ